MVYTAVNFVATMFALFMLEKMSKAIWSKKLTEEEKSGKTSQMDREVAAGWFDIMLLDTDYKFVNYKQNIPPGCSDTGHSDASINESEDEDE